MPIRRNANGQTYLVHGALREGNYLQVLVNGRGARALVDTGATRSCISENFAHALRVRTNAGDTKESKVYTANGRSMIALGDATVSVRINEIVFPVTVQILRGLSYNLVLGIDWLQQTAATINFSENVIMFHEDLCGAEMISNADNVAYTVNRCVIPARSEAIVRLASARPYDGCDVTVLVEPCSMISRKCLMLAKSINTITRNRLVGRVMNPTNTPVILKKGAAVAKVTFLPPGSVCEISQSPSENGGTSSKEEITLEECKKALEAKGLDIKIDGLTKDQFEQFCRLLHKNLDVFASSVFDMPGTDLVEHRIELTDTRPIRQRQYRMSPEMQKEMARQVEDMLKADIIEESTSPWCNPVLLVKKPDGSMRFVADMRRLNAVTKPMYWPLPVMEDIIDKIGSVNPLWYSLLDLRQGYHQAKLHKDSRPYTAFSFGNSHFQFKKTTMGLTNSPHHFGQLCAKVLGGLPTDQVLCYVDDILLMTRSYTDHTKLLAEVFDRFRRANLRLHPGKCRFFAKSVKYLGHVWTRDGLQVDQAKTEVIRSFPRPRSKKQVKSFLGILGYYRRFVDKFSQKAAPLRALLKEDCPFRWTDEEEVSFETLKEALINPPVLTLPDATKPFSIHTDASLTGISYVLCQTDGKGQEHPVAYGGRALKDAETRYTISELECLAILEGIKQYHIYLASKPFDVYTDHISLKFLQNMKLSSRSRLVRWALALQGYQYRVHYKPGKVNTAADGISRMDLPKQSVLDKSQDELLDEEARLMAITPNISETARSSKQKPPKRRWWQTKITFEQKSGVNAVDTTPPDSDGAHPNVDNIPEFDIRARLPDCPDFKDMVLYLRDGIENQDPKIAESIRVKAPNYQWENGYLIHIHKNRAKGINKVEPEIRQLCVPKSLREILLKQYHDLNGHGGLSKTYQTIRNKFFWHGLMSDCFLWTRTCDRCQRAKNPTHGRKAKLLSAEVLDPNVKIAIDHLGPLPKTKDGFRYVLVVVDTTTMMASAYPCRTTSAEEVADILYNCHFVTWGVPLYLLSDRHSSFMGQVMKTLSELFQIKLQHTSAFHPRSNKAELFNATLGKTFRAYLTRQDEWADLIPPILYAYRGSVLTSIRCSPFWATFGRPMLANGIDMTLTGLETKHKSFDDYLLKFMEKLELTKEVVKAGVEDAAMIANERYEKANVTRLGDYVLGQQVLVFDPTTAKGQSKKLKVRWTGPFRVVDIKGKGRIFRLQNVATGALMRSYIHYERLRPYRADRTKIYRRNRGRQVQTRSEENVDKTQMTETQRAHLQKLGSDWALVKKLLAFKKVNGKPFYEVLWSDDTTSWQQPKDITQYCIDMFWAEQYQNKKLKKQERRKW